MSGSSTVRLIQRPLTVIPTDCAMASSRAARRRSDLRAMPAGGQINKRRLSERPGLGGVGGTCDAPVLRDNRARSRRMRAMIARLACAEIGCGRSQARALAQSPLVDLTAR